MKLEQLKQWADTLSTMRDEVETECKAVASALERAEAATYPKAKDKSNTVKPLRARLAELGFTLALIQRGGFVSGEIDSDLALDFLRRVKQRGLSLVGRKSLPHTLERIAELEKVARERIERATLRAAQEAQLAELAREQRRAAIKELANELRG